MHWSSIKWKRVTRNVLASELYTIYNGSDVILVAPADFGKGLIMQAVSILQKNTNPLFSFEQYGKRTVSES
jgi:hypothetical protein